MIFSLSHAVDEAQCLELKPTMRYVNIFCSSSSVVLCLMSSAYCASTHTHIHRVNIFADEARLGPLSSDQRWPWQWRRPAAPRGSCRAAGWWRPGSRWRPGWSGPRNGTRPARRRAASSPTCTERERLREKKQQIWNRNAMYHPHRGHAAPPAGVSAPSALVPPQGQRLRDWSHCGKAQIEADHRPAGLQPQSVACTGLRNTVSRTGNKDKMFVLRQFVLCQSMWKLKVSHCGLIPYKTIGETKSMVIKLQKI